MMPIKVLTNQLELVKSKHSGDRVERRPIVLSVPRQSKKNLAQSPHFVRHVGSNSALSAKKI